MFALFNFQDPTRLSFLRRLARISSVNQSVNSIFTNLAKICYFHTLHKKKAVKSSFIHDSDVLKGRYCNTYTYMQIRPAISLSEIICISSLTCQISCHLRDKYYYINEIFTLSPRLHVCKKRVRNSSCEPPMYILINTFRVVRAQTLPDRLQKYRVLSG